MTVIHSSLRKFISLCILCFCVASVYAQVQPGAYNGSTQVNFIKTLDAVAPTTSEATFLAKPTRDVRSGTVFFDGLGRPLQSVVKMGSMATGSTATDFLSANYYDNLGREKLKFLPFASSANTGTFKLDPFQQQDGFYATQLNGQNETYYYGQTDFEASPLNRASKVYAPGNSWVASQRGVSTKYYVNADIDDVKSWTVSDVTNGWGTYAISSVYGAGQLFKTVVTDEQGNQVIEFKDKEGKVVTKKVQLTASTDTGNGSGYTGWLSTIYVYDAFGKLRLVIQPRGVELLISNSWNINALNGIF